MNSLKLKYQKIRGYKYRLVEPFSWRVDIHVESNLSVPGGWVVLRVGGWMHFRPGYAWDGASGPAVDTRTWMVASLVHDGLYQIIRANGLEPKARRAADNHMRQILIGSGMNPFRAWYSYAAVRLFGNLWQRRIEPHEENEISVKAS